MPKTTKTDVIIPEIFTQAVRGAFAQKNALMGSLLAATGAAVVQGDFAGGPNDIGDEVTVPYFGTLGEFEPNNTDGDPAVIKKIAQTSEKAVVGRDSLAFEVTRWGRNAAGGVDPYEEAAQQIVTSAERAMDRKLVGAAVAAGGLRRNVFSTSSPVNISYDLVVDAKMLWGDEQEDIVAMMVHSKTMADLLKLKDAAGRPILTMPTEEGQVPRLLGTPIGIADSMPTTGSVMSSVTSSGTSPPVVTLSGTPNGAHKLRIIITVGGALGTAKFKFSLDDGENYSAEILTAASVTLTDPAVDSLIGANGKSGLTAGFASNTYNVDNVYTATTILKVRTLLLKRASLAFWYNRAALALQTDKDILVDSGIGAMHLYSAPHRYRRRPGGTKPGVVVIEHNVSA